MLLWSMLQLAIIIPITNTDCHKVPSSCEGNRIEKNRYFPKEMEIKFQEAFHNEVKKMVSDH